MRLFLAGPLPVGVVIGLSLVMGFACKRPETAVRERPVQRIELIQTVEGMTPLEEKALVAQLAEGLGLSADPPEAPAGAVRVFRLTLKGTPNPYTERGLGKTWLISTGYGALLGVLVPTVGMTVWATGKSAAIAAGVGGLLGFGYGPIWFRNNQALLKDLGYLPWGFTAEWEVLERSPGLAEEVVARSGNPPPFFGNHTPILDLKPHLKPLPAEHRSAEDVRQASLRAYGEALAKHFRKKG